MMERLTWRRPGDNAVCARVPKDSDRKWIVGEFTQEVYNRLAGYEDAEEQGRLIVLPCKPGDTIYQLRKKSHALGPGVHERHVACITVWGPGEWSVEHGGKTPCRSQYLGKTWFLTREEAEAALKEE